VAKELEMGTIKIITIIIFGINAIMPLIFRDIDYKVQNTLGWVCAIIMAL